MPNIVAVVKDDRVRRQIEQFVTELGIDDARVASFKSQQEFEALYYKEAGATADSPEGQALEGESLSLFSEVHLVIFALDSITGKSGAFIDRARANLKKFGRHPSAAPVRFVLLKYEDDGIQKLDLLHPSLDDLVYLPLDRLVFLQKLEILVTIPKLVTPRFLFNQEVRHDIEISKIVKLDRLSDVGMAIRNPVPLKAGLPGRFYLLLPGEKNRLDLRGKVIRSEPHPEQPGQFLVYFGFFGLPKSALTTIRRALSKAPRYQSLLSDDRELVRYKPDELFGTKDTERMFSLAVIDPDEASGNALAQQLSKEMDRLHVVTENSYSLFLHKYFQTGGSGGKMAPPQPTAAKDFYAPAVKLNLTPDLKCSAVEPVPMETDILLGYQASALFEAPDKWLACLQDKEARLVLEEALQLAAGGRTMERLVILNDNEGQRRAVHCKLVKTPEAENQVTVEMGPAGLDHIMAKMTSEDTSKALDVLVVETSFVPEDTAAWIENLRARAKQLNLVKNPQGLRFLIIAETEAAAAREALFESPDILGLFIKPVDTRQMLFFLSEMLGNRNTLFHFDNLGWAAPGVSIHVAKPVHLEALSEFGATLRSSAKLAPGSMVYLRRSIYDSAPNACLAARVYHCLPHPSEQGYFQVFTTYFGINDAFLKFARTWIRENYAHQKSQSGG